MTREILLFFIIFSAGLLIAVFLGIVWITKVLEQTSLQMKKRIAERMTEKLADFRPGARIPSLP